jgi:hypothetical protein
MDLLPPWYFKGREGITTWQVGNRHRALCDSGVRVVHRSVGFIDTLSTVRPVGDMEVTAWASVCMACMAGFLLGRGTLATYCNYGVGVNSVHCMLDAPTALAASLLVSTLCRTGI